MGALDLASHSRMQVHNEKKNGLSKLNKKNKNQGLQTCS